MGYAKSHVFGKKEVVLRDQLRNLVRSIGVLSEVVANVNPECVQNAQFRHLPELHTGNKRRRVSLQVTASGPVLYAYQASPTRPAECNTLNQRKRSQAYPESLVTSFLLKVWSLAFS